MQIPNKNIFLRKKGKVGGEEIGKEGERERGEREREGKREEEVGAKVMCGAGSH